MSPRDTGAAALQPHEVAERRAYRLGVVCEETGLTPRQVRSWERLGVVRPVRTPGNQRVYTAAEVRTLHRARKLRSAGLGLAQVCLTLRILAGNQLGADSAGIREVRTLLTQIRREVDVADELLAALHELLLRRAGAIEALSRAQGSMGPLRVAGA